MAETGADAAQARTRTTGGFNVLDGVALVIGAAVASIHLRDLVAERPLSGFGWGLVWITFSGVALSAAGPFVLVVRRSFRRLERYPRLGDGLWAVLGVPWVSTALIRPRGLGLAADAPRFGALGAAATLYTTCLWLLLLAASLVSLVLVWKTWVLAPPERLQDRESSSWTDRFGLALAVAWPLQCAFGLVVTG
jgi:hypothetical protein